MSLMRNLAPSPSVRNALAAAGHHARGRRGAALIIVIAIMTILLAIALTFFTTANIEVRVTTNVSNTVRAEFLQDAASAIAISALNQDFLNHPQATSLDHPWRSYFNGAAFAGKPWARFKGNPLTEQVINSVRNPGMPELNFTAIETRYGSTVYLRFQDGLVEPLFQGGRSKPWLYIPRYQGPSAATGGLNALVIYDCAVLEEADGTLITPDNLNSALQAAGLYVAYYLSPDNADCLDAMARTPVRPVDGGYGLNSINDLPLVTDNDVPFVTSTLYGQVQVDGNPVMAAAANDLDNLQYPDEQIGTLVDVDNNGDGQPDSMWLPIPSDLYFPQDGVDNNLNGWADEQQDDNLNNDAAFEGGDMVITNAITYMDTSQGNTQFLNDLDEAIEPGVFVYYAGDDGLDNDNDGAVDSDDPDENGSGPNQGLFLTAPLPGLSFYLDLDADGRAYDLVPDEDIYQDILAAGTPPFSATDIANAISASMRPLRVLLPGTIRVLYNGAYVLLSVENVDTIDNDYDLVVNDYAAYCYVGPNNLPNPFRPPFETFFESDGTFKNTNTQDVFNSYLRVFGGTATAAWITTNVPPVDYYETWRAPGNWFQPLPTGATLGGLGTNPGQQPTFADLRNVLGDPVLYATPRRKSFVEVSADALDADGDGSPDLTFSPRSIRLYNRFQGIDTTVDLNQSGPLQSAVHITSSGEPVCELSGRAAILITDEASKVNVNVAGAHVYNDEYPTRMGARYEANTDNLNTKDAGPISRASQGEGQTPAEYEVRMLPGVGQITAGRLWAGRTGSPGNGAVATLDAGTANQVANRTLLAGGTFDPGILLPSGENYALDASLPGYGRTDDNGDALLLALNGRDDNGNGLIDEGLFLPKLSASANDTLYGAAPIFPIGSVLAGGADPTLAPLRLEILRYLEYFNRLGNLEGIDDPAEFLIAKAVRNLAADRDGIDNNQDGVIDANSGELADRVYTDLNIDEISARAGVSVEAIKNLITTFSTDRNANFVETLSKGIRALNKIDFNYATAQQIAAALLVQGDFLPITNRTITQTSLTGTFAEGLRRGTTHVRAPDPTPDQTNDDITGGFMFASTGNTYRPTTVGPYHTMPADPFLEALQIAANIKDTVDRAYGRTELVTERTDAVVPPVENATVVNWPTDTELNARERLSGANLLVTEDVENYITQILGLAPKRLQSVDTWWTNFVEGLDSTSSGRGEQRHITYAVAGQEAIRINELMVRPVRRVEAEMMDVIDTDTLTAGIQRSTTGQYVAANPLDPMRAFPFASSFGHVNFDPAPPFDLNSDGIFESDPLPDFNMTRQTLLRALDNTSELDFSDPLAANDTWGAYTSNGGTPEDTLGEETSIASTVGPVQNMERTLPNLTPPPATVTDTIVLPDVVQFIVRGPRVDPNDPFAPPAGLPSGRYYLTINTLDPVTGRATINNAGELDYSIKYVTVEGDNQITVETTNSVTNGAVIDETILGDIYRVATNQTLIDLNTYFTNHFVNVPVEHIAGKPGSTSYIEGRRPGWVFLDGTPSLPGPSFAGYFLEGKLDIQDRGAETPSLPNRYFVVNKAGTGPDTSATPAGPTHTVYVPDAGSNFALCIAFKRNSAFISPNPGVDPIPTISLNFFDFQQQPDHEYIELANTSSEEVDIGGWNLEIGIPRRSDEEEDPNKSKWIVPDGTTVAPGGMVLLGFDVFDGFQNPDGEAFDGIESAIGHNGIGLAATETPVISTALGLPELSSVTAPPIHDVSDVGAAFGDFGNMFEPLGRFADPTGSVFVREPDARFGIEIFDYVDRNGDGLSSYFMAAEGSSAFQQEVASRGVDAPQGYFAIDAVNDDARLENDQITSTPGLTGGPGKPWDRIVQLINVEVHREADPASGNRILPRNGAITLANANDPVKLVNNVADFVLRGGFLPDYPDHDGIDNDGDGAYFIQDGNCNDPALYFAYKYVPGTLDKDMVDNDLNGLIDERGVGVDVDNDNCIDLVGDVYPDVRLSEGVDEGNLFQAIELNGFDSDDAEYFYSRSYGPGSFEAGILPAVFINNRTDYVTYFNNAAPFQDTALNETGLLAMSAEIGAPSTTRLGGPESFLATAPSPTEAYYLGSDLDPPDWKAFAERRWNPGDNVIVSLYDKLGGVADRATYREYDVVNRTLDDIAISPYRDSGGRPISLVNAGLSDVPPNFAPATGVSANAYQGFPTAWRPNHMGLDFYRSLERKDPSYPGDNFGTSNRWEATDGNYDDWAESMPLFRAFIRTNAPNFGAPLREVLAITPRLPGSFADNWELDWARLYRHALYGSPLRMNLATRLLRNPADLTRSLADDVASVNGDQVLGAFQLDRSNSNGPDERPRSQFPSLNVDTLYANTQRLAELLPNRDWAANKAAGEDHYTHRDLPLPGNIDDLFDGNLEDVLLAGTPTENFDLRAPGQELRSAGDLLRLPLTAQRQDMFNLATVNLNAGITDAPFFYSADNIGYERNNAFYRFPANYVSGVLGRDETDAERGPALTEAMDLHGTQPVVLSVGNALFTPVAPAEFEIRQDSSNHPLPSGVTYSDLINFTFNAAGTDIIPPHAWSPIYTYELPDDDTTVAALLPPNNDALPFYPAYPNGARSSLRVEPHYLFSSEFLFPNGAGAPSYFSGSPRGGASPDYGLNPAQLDNKAPDRARRAPLERRVAMYVSGYRAGLGANDRADAVFTWDEDDGLENGEYIAYVGTYLPGLRDRVFRADGDAADSAGGSAATELYTATAPLSNRFNLPTPGVGADLVIDELLGYENTDNSQRRWNPNLQMEFITERVRARGIATTTNDGGLLPPALWQPGIDYKADADGRVFYGTLSEGAWQPIVVRVTDNFLALRVRNASSSSNEIAAISYVVLTPRKRVPGKININTAQFAQTTVGGDNAIFSSLLGLPGVYNDREKVAPFEDVAPPLGPNNAGGWNALETALGGVLVPPQPSTALDGSADQRARAAQIAGLMQAGRTNHADGRYYLSTSELARDDKAFEYDPANGATRPDTTGRSAALYPLSNSNFEETRFEEVERRYRRIANSITVRSDVFEITATVQSGYGIDADGDGRFNYRSPDEFVTTAESKGRVVYERRAATDNAGVSGN